LNKNRATYKNKIIVSVYHCVQANKSCGRENIR